MPVFGNRVLRCHDGHLFVASESERLFGSIHLGWWRMMQCPVDGRFRMCGNVLESSLSPDQRGALQHYGQWPAPATADSGPSASAGGLAPTSPPTDDEVHRVQALSKMKELLDAGLVTQQEFEAEKRRILRNSCGARPDGER